MLNHLARIRMQTGGNLTGPTLETRTGLTLQTGDRIVVWSNWYAHSDLRNGQTGTITTVDAGTSQVRFRRDFDGVEVVLPKRDLDQSVDYGYAQTIHTAQGHTYDRVHVYVDQTMSAEHGYTGLSRAGGETHLWTTDPPGPLGDCSHLHCRPVIEDRMETLARQLSRSEVRPAATESHPVVGALGDRQLVDRRDALKQLLTEGLDQPTPHLEVITRHSPRIDDHTLLVAEYSEIREEIARRGAARALLYQTDTPEELVQQIGARSHSPDPQGWDAAVAVYAKTRLEVGPDADITDPAVARTGPWRDAVHALRPIEAPPPTLRLTG